MTEKDFQIRPTFDGMADKIAGSEPNLEQLIFNYYNEYFKPSEAFVLTQKYIKTLLAMKDPAGVM